MNKRLLFFTEDQPGLVGHQGLIAKIYRIYIAFIDFAIHSEIAIRRPAVAVVSQNLKERRGSNSLSKLVSANYVTALGFSKANVDPLIRFRRTLVRCLITEGGESSRISFEAVANRGVLANLLEHMARPIGAYHSFFSEQPEAKELLLLETVSPNSRIAAKVALSLGWKVRLSWWCLLLSPLAWLKLKAKNRKDGLPTISALAAGYQSEPLPPEMPDLVFFCVDERRIRRLSSTAKALAARGQSVGIAVLNVKAEVAKALEELQSTGLPLITVNRCLPAPIAKLHAEEAFSQSLSVWKTALESTKAEPENDLIGISLADFCLEHLLSQCAKFTMEAGLFESAARNYLEQKKPKTVFISDVGLHSMIMARLCEEFGIKTIFYVYNPLLFTVPYWRGILFESLRTTFVFTATATMAETYRAHGGYEKKSLRVVGDVFAAAPAIGAAERDRENFRSRAEVKSGEKIVLALSFFVGADISLSQKRHFFRTVDSAVKKLPGAKLVVKAHPNESKQHLESMLASDGITPALLTQNDDLKMLLNASDAVCMMFSQAGMEVVLAEVPLLIVQSAEMLKGFEDWVPYVREGAAATAETPEQLASELEALLFNEEAKAKRLRNAAAFREKFISPAGLDSSAAMEREISEALAGCKTPENASLRG
jgi:hypothetical protein